MVSKLEIDEDAGELLCDRCEGRGSLPEDENPYTLAVSCTKCQGRGKVDWVSHITGVPKPKMFNFSTSSSSWAVGPGTSGVHDDIVDALATQLAAKIDEEIMDSIVNDSNKYVKLYNQEVKQLDNGIVSKFLFHTDT